VSGSGGYRLDVEVDGGKYRIIQGSSGELHIERHGEPWLRSGSHVGIVGSKMIIAMACELEELREAAKGANSARVALEKLLPEVQAMTPRNTGWIAAIEWAIGSLSEPG
jgi:hypothetical protein